MTRDSWLFSWLAVAVAFGGYLATGPAPTAWDWPHWVQAAVTLGGLIMAKLGQSPLPSAAEANAINPRP